jgi:hypothetical protein
MTQALAMIKFNTYAVHISRTSSSIIVFKYNTTRCELEVFTDSEEASEYIITGLSEWFYTLSPA